MIDPSIIVTIAEIAQKIYEQVEKTGKLKPLAADLAYRIRVIQEFVDRIKNLKDTSRLDNLINRLKGVIDECLVYAIKIAEMNDIKKFFKAGSLTETHDELIGKLDSIITDLGVALDAAILAGQVKEAEKNDKYKNELVAHQKTFEAELKTDLIGLQAYAAEILQQGDAAQTKLDGLNVTLHDIKAKLDALQESAHKADPTIPPTIKITVLAKGAKAREVVHETIIGVAVGNITMPEKSDQVTIDMAQQMAAFMLDKTKEAHKTAPRPNIEVTVLEAKAYADFVKERILEAQPGNLTITERHTLEQPGKASAAASPPQ